MKLSHYLLAVIFSIIFYSCDHTVITETVVYPDDSLDRTITLQGDSSDINTNFFGINDKSGWEVNVTKNDSSENKKLIIAYKKHFNSIEESNLELDSENDTLFHIEGRLEKRFRWFYTYQKYSDTYKAIDRFKLIKQEDFLTPEDYAFMERLPAEGDSISKADELFLEDLTTKINDVLVPRAVFEEHFALFQDLIKQYRIEDRWLDTLKQHKESIYSLLLKKEDMGDDALLIIFDSLQIPFPQPEVEQDYRQARKPIESRLEFMSHSNNGKYIHSITLPGKIINTNADSLSDNYALWKPSVYKFLAKDYTMYAETRQLNIWAVIVSILVLLATIYVFVKKR